MSIDVMDRRKIYSMAFIGPAIGVVPPFVGLLGGSASPVPS